MNTLGKILWSLVVLAIGLVLVWIYLAVRLLLTPNGFWQELVLVGLGVWVLGFVQLIFGFVALLLIFSIWKDS